MRCLVAVLLVGVLAGCSGSAEPEPTRAAPKPSATATTMAPDRLADLSAGVEGKILLRHTDAKGTESSWSGRFTAPKGYQVHLHCIPGEVAGDLVAKIGGVRLTVVCGEEAVLHEVDVPGEEFSVRVEAPSGAKWAVLVNAMPA